MGATISGLLLTAGLLAARDWPLFGGDLQRDGWAKEEHWLSRQTARNIKLEWKVKLGNVSRELNSLTAPIVAERLLTPRGFKDVVFVAGSSNTVYAVDVDNGELIWQRTLNHLPASATANFLCPNSLNATPIIDPARMEHTDLYVLTGDGDLHLLNAVNGEDRTPAQPFVPPNAKAWSLGMFHGNVYTTVSQGCGGAKSGIYSLRLDGTRNAARMISTNGGIWGRAGAAMSPDGVLYAETGDGQWDPKTGNYADSFIAVSSEDLSVLDYYTPVNHEWITHKDLDMGAVSPVWFQYGNRSFVAGGGKEGVLFLLDAKSLGGPDHQTPLFRSPKYANAELNLAGRGFWGAFASWQDPAGARWLYAPVYGPQAPGSPVFPITDGPATGGSIMAFRVEGSGSNVTLTAAWRSRGLTVPEPPVVANGLVFVLSSGEDTQSIHSSGRIMTSQERISGAVGNAVLYAFDSSSGKELFSSQKLISGFSHFSGLAVDGGHIYVVTYENVLYSFGLGTEQ